MKYVYVKIVTCKNGQKMYYIGNGLWFGRTSEKRALNGLADGSLFLWK